MLLDRFAALVAPGTRSRPGPDVSVEIVEKGPLRFSKGTQDAARAKQCLPAGLVAGAGRRVPARAHGAERRVGDGRLGALGAVPRRLADERRDDAQVAALRRARAAEARRGRRRERDDGRRARGRRRRPPSRPPPSGPMAMLSFGYSVLLQFCRFAILSFCDSVVLRFCRFAILSFCDYVVLRF